MSASHCRGRGRWRSALAGALVLASASVLAQAPAQPVAWPALRLVDGRTVAADHWRGRPVIVVFWATWCGFCERHNARVQKLFASLGERGPQVLGVSIDGDAAAVARLARTRGWRFPLVVDDGSLRRQFTPRRLVPMTCLVDAEAALRQCIPGEMAEDDVMALARPPGR